jgi:HEAT repeat protein
MGAVALDALIELLNDESQPVEARWRAAHLLGGIGDRRAIPALINALRDPSSDVQYYAAWALGVLRDPQGFNPLQAILNGTKLEEQANYAAAISLVQIDHERGLATLRQTLTADNEAARRVARGALASLEYS